MSRNGLRLAMAAALTLAVGIGLLGVANAGVTEVDSKVTITDGGPDGAEGKVTSSDPDCEKGRNVTLYALPPGKGAAGEVEVGDDKTDKKGKWEVEAQLFAGDYVAEVAAKTIKSDKQKHRKKCKRKRSKKKRL